jgi:hypothetical protein
MKTLCGYYQKVRLKATRHKRLLITFTMMVLLALVHISLIPSFTKSYNDPCYMSEHHMKTLRYILTNVIDVFNIHNVQYWLDYGTLLGALHHNDVIPYDSDGDVSFIRHDPNVRKAISTLGERGISANTMVADMEGVSIDFMRWEAKEGWYKGHNATMLYKYYPPWSQDNIIVKINHKFDAFPQSWVGKRRKVKFLTKDAYIPQESEQLIKFRYKWTHWMNVPYKWKCYVPCALYDQPHCKKGDNKM